MAQETQLEKLDRAFEKLGKEGIDAIIKDVKSVGEYMEGPTVGEYMEMLEQYLNKNIKPMNTIFLNPNLIEAIDINESTLCTQYEWREASSQEIKGILGSKPKIKKIEEGFYKGDRLCTNYEITQEDNLCIVGKQVFTKARAYISYNRGSKSIYFKSPAEVEAFIAKMEKAGIFVKWLDK